MLIRYLALIFVFGFGTFVTAVESSDWIEAHGWFFDIDSIKQKGNRIYTITVNPLEPKDGGGTITILCETKVLTGSGPGNEYYVKNYREFGRIIEEACGRMVVKSTQKSLPPGIWKDVKILRFDESFEFGLGMFPERIAFSPELIADKQAEYQAVDPTNISIKIDSIQKIKINEVRWSNWPKELTRVNVDIDFKNGKKSQGWILSYKFLCPATEVIEKDGTISYQDNGFLFKTKNPITGEELITTKSAANLGRGSKDGRCGQMNHPKPADIVELTFK